jgi:hypothetical protein
MRSGISVPLWWRCAYRVQNRSSAPNYGGSEFTLLTPLFGFQLHRCYPDWTSTRIASGWWLGFMPRAWVLPEGSEMYRWSTERTFDIMTRFEYFNELCKPS